MSLMASMGFLMVIVFMYLIMSKRMSAMVALMLVPVVFMLSLGFAPQLGKWAFDGVKQVAPTGIMICFAILFFGVMIDAGLFDPLIKKILQMVHGDPVKVAVGTAVLAAIISLDGDGSTTYMVTCSAMLAVHRRIGLNPLILPSLAVMQNSVMNIIPWGGPTGRVLASLGLEAGDVFVPLIPGMVVGTLWVCFIAYRWGLKERERLGIIHLDNTAHAEQAAMAEDPEVEKLKRPQMFWANLALTTILMVALMYGALPLAILFMIGTGLALLINYRSLKEQQERIVANGANAMPVVAMVFAAGIFMGVMSGSKMVDAMAKALIAAIPPELGPHMAFISALLSLPGTFFLTNDAYYFGVLPVLAKAGATYGVSAAEMGRAALIGQGAHLLSPLVPSTYLLVGLNKVEFGDLQKFALLPAIGISVLWLITAVVLGYIHI
ncbi:CitMHS family citrate-Mg2+:H+ or citrate-Ca2+:H+ symporter [Anaerospora hongkongensis]|uniref:CitMHS family citrate-Mg2+:H+ or citrate-Ca2+:H+ symporter n=1 Tax=Anaerospora hongkongensis TaxID=244830 RepID=A0A4R1PVI6_9FIRM|nr:citrate:proton symporter [Anaerospora hongkongensis]TCL35381.1 CitMHS family citrate-Mg2+:H+ or citrate-Ca2+:H+ symporter [Anaerospora hongkongensis]